MATLDHLNPALFTDLAVAIDDLLHWYYDNAKVIFAICIVTAVAGELVTRAVRGRRIDIDSTLTSFSSGLAFLGVKFVLGKLAYIAIALYVYNNHRLFNLDLGNPLVWIGVFLGRDFVYYWAHRAEHSYRFLWASHLVHHSPETIGMTTAVRVPWMEAIYKPWIGLWLPLVGFNPVAAIAFDVFASTLSQVQHTEAFAATRRSVLGWLFVTPSAHRVHHGYNPEYLDKNFGAVLILWDRLFGTYEPEVAPVRYGVGAIDAVVTPRDALVGGYPRLVSAMRSTGSVPGAIRVALAKP